MIIFEFAALWIRDYAYISEGEHSGIPSPREAILKRMNLHLSSQRKSVSFRLSCRKSRGLDKLSI